MKIGAEYRSLYEEAYGVRPTAANVRWFKALDPHAQDKVWTELLRRIDSLQDFKAVVPMGLFNLILSK